jgi:alkylation response protein AidB-like acyl-CoA dehydrogenase
MTYRSPVSDILFSLNHVAGLNEAIGQGLFGELDAATAALVIEEAGRFATDAIAPLNRTGDLNGSKYQNGSVTTPPGFRDAYRAWAAGGWAGVTGAPEFGGMGLPHAVSAACCEIWNGASMGFALCPLLSEGAVNAVARFAASELRDVYLPRLISGEWTGTMNLTEPQAGSDLNAVKARAERAGDGTYRLFGQKIFITYGEHDMADNICHLVLARLPDAPSGTRGISLFLVPKFLPKADGAPGERNDVRCASIEHKIGIHASPTCVMIYGDAGGARGWLVGEENRGLNAMFAMMNSARLGVGLQGVAIGDRALQQALSYARERRQGRSGKGGNGAMSPIVEHPDVQRMLLTMRALVHAARGICHLTAVAIDLSHHAKSEEERRQAEVRAALLTPVAKAFSTDIGDEVASLGVQVHGGMGYIEETGAAQYFRDSRIAAIYEGTNGVQAIDLALRKLPLGGGAAIAREIADMKVIEAQIAASGGAGFGATASHLGEALAAFERATRFMTAERSDPDDALAGATQYLRLFGLVHGGACLAKAGLAAEGLAKSGDSSELGRVALARFFAEKILPAAPGLAAAVENGAGALQDFERAIGG